VGGSSKKSGPTSSAAAAAAQTSPTSSPRWRAGRKAAEAVGEGTSGPEPTAPCDEAAAYEPLHQEATGRSGIDHGGQEAIAGPRCSYAPACRTGSPAYLSVPAGHGKTSQCPDLARSLNVAPAPPPPRNPAGCWRSATRFTALATPSIVMIEVDAASNTGVDKPRELIERSRFSHRVQAAGKV